MTAVGDELGVSDDLRSIFFLMTTLKEFAAYQLECLFGVN